MRACIGSIAAALLSLLATSAGAAPQGEDPIEDRVEVVERLVLVEVPPGTPGASDGLSVTEGGVQREVVGIDRVGSGDWTVVVYVDWPRTPPPMIWSGALALAREAETLTALGTVRVLDGGLDEEGDAGTTEPGALVERLADVARRAAERPAAPPSRGLGEDREADGTLLAATESACPRVPCLLVLVSDGYSAATASSGEADPDPIARRLSVSGWTVLALPLVAHDPDQPALPDSTGQKTSTLLDLVPVFRVWPWRSEKPRGAGQPLSTLDMLTEPRWAPLRTWADQTGGWIVRHEEEVPELLDRLSWRHLLVYRSPVAEDGAGAADPLSLEVRDGGGRSLEAPSWVEPVEAANGESVSEPR